MTATVAEEVELDLRHLIAGPGGIDSEALGDFSLFPPRRPDAVSFRVSHEALLRFWPTAPHRIVSSWTVESGYLNLHLHEDWLSRRVVDAASNLPDWYPRRGTRWLIEHTSLNPVYPLNIATFRSTCLGAFLASLLRRCGCEVSTRYWVQDLARQVNLVREHLPMDVLDGSAKPDHLIGAVFASRVLEGRVSAGEAATLIATMFPSVDINRLRSFQSISSTNRAVSEHCLVGVAETLDGVGVEIDSYDFESDLLARYPPEDLYARMSNLRIGGRLLPLVKEDSSLPTYLVRNIAYYFDLLASGYACVSVVPARQRDVLESARSYALALADRGDDDLRLLYYADVLSEDGYADAIREARFSSLDETLRHLDAESEQPGLHVRDGLKLSLLATTPHRPIRLRLRPKDVVRRPLRWQRALRAADTGARSPAQARSILLAAIAAIDALQAAAISFNPTPLVRACDKLADALRDPAAIGGEARSAATSALARCWSCLVGREID